MKNKPNLASFPETNPNPVVEVSPSGKILYLNPAARKLFPSLTSKLFEHPYLRGIQSIFQNSKRKNINRDVKINGNWFAQSIHHISETKCIRIYGFQVTHRKKTEEALKERERMLKETQKISLIGTWAHDFINDITYWSDETYHIYGYKPKEVVPSYKSLNKVVHPDDRKQVKDIYYNSLKEGKKGYSNKFRIIQRSTSESRTIYEKCEFIRNSQGKPVRSIGMIQDITKRDEFEEELLKFSQAVEQSSASVVITDLNGKIEYVNRGFVDTTGYSYKEALGKNPRILKSDQTKPEIYRELWATITSGRTWKGELCNKKKNKDLFWEQVSISPVKNFDGKIINYLAVKNDITESKNLGFRKDEFITIAGHELRTPISAIKLSLQILQGILKNNPSALKYLAKIERQSNIEANLINDLLDVQKIQSGKLEIRKEEFSMKELVKEVVDNMQKTTKKHKITISGELDGKIFTDKDRIGRVLTNLCTNAIKYSPKGKRIIIKLRQDKNEATVSVTDFGIGIPKKHHHGIFRRFYRVYGSAQEAYPGLGMGLYISYQIIKLLKGKMWFDSKPKKGSTFYFSLPLE